MVNTDAAVVSPSYLVSSPSILSDHSVISILIQANMFVWHLTKLYSFA